MPIATLPSSPKVVAPILGHTYHLLGNHRDTILGIEGRRGTAKTASILFHIIARAKQHKGTHWLLARSTRTLLSDSVLRTLEEQVLPVLRIPKPNAGRFHCEAYPVGNDSFLIPRGLDEMNRNQSAEYAGGYLAEATEMGTRQEVEALTASLREEGVDYHQLVCDWNPHDPNHWLNHTAEDVTSTLRRVKTIEDYQRLLEHNAAPVSQVGRWKRIVTHWADNPGYWQMDPFGPTKLGYDYIEKNLAAKTGALRRRWYEGEWAAAEGAVFPEFDDRVHVLDNDFTPPADWPQVLGFDPGWHLTGIVWMAISPAGGLYVYDAIQEGHVNFDGHLSEIQRRNSGSFDGDPRNVERYFGDPNEFFSGSSKGQALEIQARARGFRFLRWPRDQGPEFEAGVEAVRTALRTPEDQPFHLRICPRAKGAISNFTSWAYKKNAKGQVIEGAERYEAANDHCLDPIRGIIQSGYLQNRWKRMQLEAA